MKQPKIRMDKESWQKGFDAGQRGEPNLPPEEVETLSYHSGYIEGQTEQSPTPKDQ